MLTIATQPASSSRSSSAAEPHDVVCPVGESLMREVPRDDVPQEACPVGEAGLVIVCQHELVRAECLGVMHSVSFQGGVDSLSVHLLLGDRRRTSILEL